MQAKMDSQEVCTNLISSDHPRPPRRVGLTNVFELVANRIHEIIALIAPLPVITTITSFMAIAWYNAIVVNVAIWLFFKRWGGLYFYSLLFASWGIVLHQLGFLIQFFGLANVFAESYTVMMTGWYPMVSTYILVTTLMDVSQLSIISLL
jgi:hypothetical protein